MEHLTQWYAILSHLVEVNTEHLPFLSYVHVHLQLDESLPCRHGYQNGKTGCNGYVIRYSVLGCRLANAEKSNAANLLSCLHEQPRLPIFLLLLETSSPMCDEPIEAPVSIKPIFDLFCLLKN